MLIDSIYYAYFDTLPPIQALKQIGQLQAVGQSISNLLDYRILLLVLDIPLLIYFLVRTRKKGIFGSKRKGIFDKFFNKKSMRVAFLFFIITLITIGIKYKFPSLNAQELYTYHIVNIKDSLLNKDGQINNKTDPITEEDILDLRERARLKTGKYTGIGKGKNLIVIQVEALQDFVIGLDYNNQEITPNLNKLVKASSSIYYDQYFQLLGTGNTADAEFVSHNSLHPALGEPIYSKYTDNTFYGLPWLLRDNGYTAWALHGYVKDFWNREEAYKGQGFQRFISEEDFYFPVAIGFGLRDQDFFQQSTDFLKELDSIDKHPFYAFLVTLTSHTPFKMPKAYHRLELFDEDKDNMLGNYLQSIHYTDRHLGKFIEDLKEEGLYDDTVIAIYGDHFAIKSTQEEASLMTKLLDREYDYDEMLHIPLIIHVPGEDIGETISTVGSQLDFYPTIMNIMGYDNTKGLVFGRDLTNYKEYNFVAPQTYLLKGSFIDNNTLFKMSKDKVFEHSNAINRQTGESVDIEQYKIISEKAKEEIHKSLYILENNLLKNYVK